ncbi:Aminoacyl-histidine dipeptidase (Peptidase D) [Cardiobacterium hominis]|uniref:Cytosol non-specific dipeptidase n=1 Tax=Cardiobacterium hominis TaxID=2718 RepID=A0A1C3H4J3_9GAMM|nr:aminoacyl-histidine dipeptidase [Cardiobacterium hominis]SAM64984.1 Aminoacyl-histidine dipeptidase (Peptidase D) [Cardiobacterium hominis]
MSIQELAPRGVWQYFYQITQIPRPSHQEEKIQQYILDEAARLGLPAERDARGNIRVCKAGSAGRENEPGVILQAHLDMVAQKNSDTVHDFSKDPIRTVVKGDWVHADGTTLGADNGIGVAMILAVLADPNLSHPPLEGLFTASEEVGLEGALAVQPGWLQGDILLNLDYEEEGELCIGCAGAVNGDYTLPLQYEALDGQGYQLRVRGLKGGHSGVEIHLQRGNAIKILARALQTLHEDKDYALKLAGITAGDLRNAIPREADAVVALSGSQLAAAQQTLHELTAQIRAELPAEDQGLQISLEPGEAISRVLDGQSAARVIAVLRNLHNGVDRMSVDIPGLVETSNNVAVVRTDDTLRVRCMLRSSVDSARDDLAARMKALLDLAGGSAAYTGAYSGWKPQPHAELVEKLAALGEKIYGKTPPVKAIHAGLECGILYTHYPHWQMAAFGPTIVSPHSPDEKVNIVSVARSYQWLTDYLQGKIL